MIFLYIAGILFLCWASVCFRLFCLHPVRTVFDLIRDIYFYFKHHRYNIYDGGLLNCFFAHFGGGKTLSVTHYVRILFLKYNNKRVFDRNRKKWVLQKVHIISNVHLNGVPYEELISLSQICCCAWRNKEIDKKENTRTVLLVLLDEASAQLNSREFKTNINADFLNSLITSRHFNMSIFYTSQKFKLVDALLRSVTQRAILCRKCWRFMVQFYYDADEIEYAANPMLVKPYRRTGFYIKDKDYNSYDTLATVKQLQKSVDKGDMMTDEEIIALRGSINPDSDNVMHASRKLKHMRKRR